MKTHDINQVKKSEDNFRVERPKQTGFSSPATHYNEPRIDLNSVLVGNSEATFYIRVVDDSFKKYDININDVLIVDKSITPERNQLAIISYEGTFEVARIEDNYIDELNLWGVVTYIIKSVK